MEVRSRSRLSIIILVFGVLLIIAGIGAILTSPNMAEGELLRVIGIGELIIGFVISIIYIWKLLRIRKQSELSF